MCRRQPVECRQHGQLDIPHIQERGGSDKKCVGPLAVDTVKGGFDLTAGVGFEHLDFQGHHASGGLYGSYRRLGAACLGRIDEHGNASSARYQITKEFEPLCVQLGCQKINACHVGAWSSEAGHKTGLHWVVGDGKCDGNCRSGRLGRESGRFAHRGDYGDSAANQIARQFGQPINLIIRAAFLLPAHLGGSGVLATIAAGLFVSWNGPLLIPAATRLQGIFFWDLIVYLLEGLVFLVTGLQIRTLLDRIDTISLRGPLLAVLLAVAVVIVARFVWVYPATYLPRWLSPALARRDPSPPWQWPFFLAFVGVRGVVSLAAALAIPLTTLTGAPFPYRDLILFVTFGVIVVTLVGQGVLLPAVVRWLGLGRHAADEREREHTAELAARAEALNMVQSRLDQLSGDGGIAPEVLAILRARHDYRVGRLPKNTSSGVETASAAADLRSELIAAEREYIYQLLREGKITDEPRRRIERELDLEEASIACRKEGGVEPPL